MDEFIAEWSRGHSPEEILALRSSWRNTPQWETQYPNICDWADFGKRHCIAVDINFASGQNHVKAWHYDKALNTETVIFEADINGLPENDVIQRLDDGIAYWRRDNEHLWGALPV
ncbi:hypothetical protein EON80_23930 [bacterium]|nr:MAG: hypothetical protein EON80_23930 [bacterium]